MFNVPDQKKIRLIINTDAKNEADDAFAVVQALLSPQLIVKGLIGAHYGTKHRDDSMMSSYLECKKIVSIMKMEDRISVFKGSERAVVSETEYEYSEGADLIVREALDTSSGLPLFVIFLGPITDLACAYLKNPAIADKLTAIWIGGNKYPAGGWEFNLSNDITAANIIFKSDIDLWQVPMNAYTMMRTSLTELEEKVAPYGEIGNYLFTEMINLNMKLGDLKGWPFGECWSLGDSPAVGLILDHMDFYADYKEAPIVQPDMSYSFDGTGRKVKVYNMIDSRFILEDMFAKIKKFNR